MGWSIVDYYYYHLLLLRLCTQTLGFSARRSYFGEQAVDFWTRLLELAILSLGYNVVGLVVGFVMMHPSSCEKRNSGPDEVSRLQNSGLLVVGR